MEKKYFSAFIYIYKVTKSKFARSMNHFGLDCMRIYLIFNLFWVHRYDIYLIVLLVVSEIQTFSHHTIFGLWAHGTKCPRISIKYVGIVIIFWTHMWGAPIYIFHIKMSCTELFSGIQQSVWVSILYCMYFRGKCIEPYRNQWRMAPETRFYLLYVW